MGRHGKEVVDAGAQGEAEIIEVIARTATGAERDRDRVGLKDKAMGSHLESVETGARRSLGDEGRTGDDRQSYAAEPAGSADEIPSSGEKGQRGFCDLIDDVCTSCV